MKFVQSKYKYWTLNEWRCCDNLWQLLLLKRYPERYNWYPDCPDCKKERYYG